MKKWVKIILFVLLGIVLVVASTIGYFYYNHHGKYDIDQKKHPHIVGYLDPSNDDSISGFTRCSDSDTRPIGYYSSASKIAFNGGKEAFRTYILNNFDKKNYSDSGFLNLRFLINCRQEIGDMEINELNSNFVKTYLNDDLVNQLITLTIKKENWNSHSQEKPSDMYMYLIYKLENGAITEILT